MSFVGIKLLLQKMLRENIVGYLGYTRSNSENAANHIRNNYLPNYSRSTREALTKESPLWQNVYLLMPFILRKLVSS